MTERSNPRVVRIEKRVNRLVDSILVEKNGTDLESFLRRKRFRQIRTNSYFNDPQYKGSYERNGIIADIFLISPLNPNQNPVPYYSIVFRNNSKYISQYEFKTKNE
jgi:hypothetical protein